MQLTQKSYRSRGLFVLAILLGLPIVVWAGVVAVWPAIPRVVTKLDAPKDAPLKDKISVGCAADDPKSGADLEGSIWGRCPGFLVTSKIRWDYDGTSLGGNHGVVVVGSSQQNNGDQRELYKRVRKWSCIGPLGWSYDEVVIKTPCQASGTTATDEAGAEFTLQEANPTPETQEECESVNWFWNPSSDACQQDAPPPCDLAPVACEIGSWSFQWCDCVPYSSPIIVDVTGDGFDLTSSADGVYFNLNKLGGKERLAWTTPSDDDAWLVLDRNGNGIIDDGTELFGDVTPQPDPSVGERKNGFRALAEYDKRSAGGNANGQIDSGDSVFSRLRLWRDTNHDGLSQSDELNSLPSHNIEALDLEYKLSKKTDIHGNQFSFRAKVKSSQSNQLGRWAWDVYLVKDSH